MAGMTRKAELWQRAVACLAAGAKDQAEALFQQAVPAEKDCVEAHLAWARSRLPGPGYREILACLHAFLQPKNYIEIGVEFGHTLKLAGPETRVFGIDPRPQVDFPLPENVSLWEMTSDVFFVENDVQSLLGGTFDLAFIDGLHIFEQVLQDIVNLERYAGPSSLIAIHDCLPLDRRTASRQRTTQFWSGDVWKIVPCLKRERPDLSLVTIPTYPTGLCLIGGLQSESDFLSRNFPLLVERYAGLDYEAIGDKETYFSLIANDWSLIRKLLPRLQDE